MIRRFLPVLSIACPVVLAAPPAAAGEAISAFTCQNGGLTRIVELREAIPDGPVCEVWYEKPTEGVPKQRLWAADNDPHYCRPKAAGFRDRLIGLGWRCAELAAPAAATGDESDESGAADGPLP